METITIHTEFIKLQDLLKFANLVSSGGEAKERIQAARSPSTARSAPCGAKKIRPGDDVAFQGAHYTVAYADS